MQLTINTRLPGKVGPEPVRRALDVLRRDMAAVLNASDIPGGEIVLARDAALSPECYALSAGQDTLTVSAPDTLGFVYGIYEISRRFLGVPPFWFWLDRVFTRCDAVDVPEGFSYESRPARVRYRGWFINDETLISAWSVERRAEGPWEMAFEALLRLGGNLVIPGTDKNAHRYRKLASDFGLIVTHHHAEPLGAEMFVRAYPGLEPSFAKYPELFRALWDKAIKEQRGSRVVWNIGFRGQGDRPFWLDDPRYDTPEARGALISALMREQYDMVKARDPRAVCCTNLYGETTELYLGGFLNIPDDVIKIWADNGYGKMVSRRQGNLNPRTPSLPPEGDGGAHGIYYHASFYDLQAASHITMLPNSASFVRRELTAALSRGADDYWLINCSNIKPHVWLLDFIAAMWRDGDTPKAPDPASHAKAFAALYYDAEHSGDVAARLLDYAKHAVSYGPQEDDHAGDQFYNHVPRMLMSQFMKNRAEPSPHLKWLCDMPTLSAQGAWCAGRFREAALGYEGYLRECEATYAKLEGEARVLFSDSILLQARLYALWSKGASDVCASLEAGFADDWKKCFYLAGRAKRAYTLADRAMRDCEHGKWVGFYANECQTGVKQTARICAYLMSFARNMGEGPHCFEWQREMQDSEEDRRVMLLFPTVNQPTDNELWALMEAKFGK